MQNNPYQAPGAELGSRRVDKRSMGWKIYFFFITILSGIGMVMYLFDPNAGLPEYVLTLVWVVATVGFFGFAFARPFYKPQFWLGFLVVYVMCSVLHYFITDMDMRAGMGDMLFYISNAIAWLIALPAYYALYLYSKPDDLAWKKK